MVNKAEAEVLVKKKYKEEVKPEVAEEEQESQNEVNPAINVLFVKMIMLLRNVQRGEMKRIAKPSSTT